MSAAAMSPHPTFATSVVPAQCPIHTSLEVLGRKWAFEILRDLTFFRDVRYTDILRANPGLTPRVLSRRLRDLEENGLITRAQREGNQKEVYHELTEKGQDTIPILASLVEFGIRHHADEVFRDGRPRALATFMPGAYHEMAARLRRPGPDPRARVARPTARSSASRSRRSA